MLRYQQALVFPGVISVDPTVCAAKNGSIILTFSGGINGAGFSATLNSNQVQSAFSFIGLDAGVDTLHLFSNDGCHYDSVVVVPEIANPEPQVQAVVKDQLCFINNGSIDLTINGADGPYFSSISNGNYSQSSRFLGLAPAVYQISIEDKDACDWDTLIGVLPYSIDSINLTVDTVNPICTALNSGTLTISVTGGQEPYSIDYAGKDFANGSTIGGLSYGNFSLSVTNKDGCLVDSVKASLILNMTPECSVISVPSAFSPIYDGT